jgi:uncharacterized membrane protein YsdA (DUF1294 family)
MAAILAFLVLVNLGTLLAFRADKRAASRGKPRLPEAGLLWLAAIGGTAGAYAGRRLWRHKTQKQPFTARLHAIASVQLLMMGIGLWHLG